MGKKVLFCASTLSHLRQFHRPYLQAFAQAGWEVWAAAEQTGELPWAHRVVALPLRKRFTSPKNLQAVLAARRLLARERFDLVSVHTALAGAVVRAAAWTLPRRPSICYTCHGYLFREQDGLKKWPYLLPEILCAPVTGLLLVMNGEDEQIARGRHLGKVIRRIDGMGFDGDRFFPLDAERRAEGRIRWGFAPQEVVFVYAAEFSPRKNQSLVLRAFARAGMENARLVLAGEGALREACIQLAEQLGLADRVLFPGRVDTADLLGLCDVVVSGSRSEGLPFHLMEGMSCGLPAVVTDVKGHRELVEPEKTGLICPPEDEVSMAVSMARLAKAPDVRRAWGMAAREHSRRYTRQQVVPQVLGEYQRWLSGLEGGGECPKFRY